MRAPIAFVFTAFLAAACAPENTIGVRFRSEAIRRATLELKTFIFGGGDSASVPSCAELDPRGLPYGDAQERSGRTALKSSQGKLEDQIAEFDELAKGTYTFVVEGWGPNCVVPAEGGGGRDEDPACKTLATSGRNVMRAYQCTQLELSAGTRKDIDLELETFAKIGAKMRIPNNFPVNAIVYDEASPLAVVDGLVGRDRFIVQLLNETSEADDDKKVRWSVSAGSGSIDGPEERVSAQDDIAGDHGLSSAVLLAGATASGVDDGKIVVQAYAPGYDDSPVEFHARALRGVTVDVSSFVLPRAKIDLGDVDPEYRLVLADDFDGDGRGDAALIGGHPGRCNPTVESQHQLAVLYGRDGGAFQPAYAQPSTKRALAISSMNAGGRRAILVSTASYCVRYGQTPYGNTDIMQAPGIEVWSQLDDVPGVGDDVLRASRREITLTTRCTGSQCQGAPRPLEKAAIGIDAKDIDGDGKDEIAMSRCSYVYSGSFGGTLQCHGDLADHTDSELVLMTADVDNGEVLAIQERATLGELGGDGGFREVRLADVSGDGSLDLVAATQTEVAVFCGRRNMPDTGFGFAANPERADASITFAQGFSVGAGRFNDDDRYDVLVGGGLRAASPNAGVKMNPGADCGFEEGPDPIIVGPRTEARLLIIRVADLNADGRDDAIVLHRETRQLETYFGSGSDLLARGPTITLPSGVNGELGLFVENPGEGQSTLAVTTAPDDNAVFTVRLSPAPKSN